MDTVLARAAVTKIKRKYKLQLSVSQLQLVL